MIDVLERHGVRYVLIGGVSGTFHGMVEYRTKDVDEQRLLGEMHNVGCVGALDEQESDT